MIEEHNIIFPTKNNPSEAHQHTKKSMSMMAHQHTSESMPMKDRESKSDSAAMQQDFDELNPPPFDDEYNRQYLNEEFIEPTNVVQLPKPEETSEKTKTDRMPKWAIEEGLVNLMTSAKGSIPSALRKYSFPDRYRTWIRNRESGIIELIELKDEGLVVPISEKILCRDLMDVVDTFKGPAQKWKVKVSEALQIAAAYVAKKHRHALPLEKSPKPFKFAHDTESLAFNIVPTPAKLDHFYPHPSFVALAPFYSSILDRNQHADVKRQFFGSLLFEGTPRKKIPIDWGTADAGKTSTNSALAKAIVGERGFAVITIDDMTDNKNLMYDLKDKMVVLVDDIPADFFKRNVSKTITGSSQKSINGKFKDAYQGNVNFRVMLTSQFMTKWTGDSGHEARIVLNQIQPIRGEILNARQMDEKLAPELPYIIADIMHAYSQIHGKDIQTPVGNMDLAKLQADENKQFAFDAHFSAVSEEELADPLFETFEVTSGEFEAAFKFNRGDTSIQSMREFVTRKYRSRVGAKYRHKRWVTNIRQIPV